MTNTLRSPPRKDQRNLETMLPPWLIERMKNEKERRPEKRIQPQLPLEDGIVPIVPEKKPAEGDERGVFEIQIFRPTTH